MEVAQEAMAKVNLNMAEEVIKELPLLENHQVTNYLTKITHPKMDSHRKI